MPLEQLSFESIKSLDGGRVRIKFEHALRALHRDCSDRPGLKAGRKLELTLTLVPCVDETGKNLETVDATFSVAAKVPKSESRTYSMRSTGDGLVYQELSPENPDQETFDFSPADLDDDVGE